MLLPRFMKCYLLFHGQCCNTTYSGCLKDDDEKGMNYRGKIAVSFSGMVCQNWDLQTPIRHKFKPERYGLFYPAPGCVIRCRIAILLFLSFLN